MGASSTKDQHATATLEGRASAAPVTLGERSLLALAIFRIFVGYLWFQQLFWKLPPDFAGLYHFVIRETHFAFIPGYSYLLQHTFLAGCTSPNSLAGCTLYTPMAAMIWTAEFLVSIGLLFGLFSRLAGLLSTLLALQLYIGLSTSEWYWTYGMLVLLGFALATVPTGRRLGVDQWLAPRLQAAASHNRLARWLSWFV